MPQNANTIKPKRPVQPKSLGRTGYAYHVGETRNWCRDHGPAPGIITGRVRLILDNFRHKFNSATIRPGLCSPATYQHLLEESDVIYLKASGWWGERGLHPDAIAYVKEAPQPQDAEAEADAFLVGLAAAIEHRPDELRNLLCLIGGH